MIITKIFFLVLFLACSIQSQVYQEWVKIYNYSQNAFDNANDIAIDNAGNIYVAGYSSNSNISLFTTVKYSSSGQQLWVSNYGNSAYLSVFVTSVELDNNSNVFITGQSNDRITTIKYSSSGAEIWVRSYTEPGIDSAGFPIGMIVDAQGNVYVIGTFGEIGDMILLKYNNAGSISWVRKFDGGNNGPDIAYSIALDQSGYVYIAGKSSITINESEFVLLKYKENGILQWTKRHPCGGLPSGVPRVKCDNDGNSYLAGGRDTYPGNKDIFITKYSAYGEIRWEKTFSGNSNSNDDISSLAVDASGNIYATGSVVNTGTEADCFTAKFDALGNLLWSRLYNGTENDADAGYRLVLDGSGNLYIAGVTSSSSNSGYDYLVLKYDNSGDLKWSSSYNGTGSNTDIARSIALDNQSNVYVTGWCSGGTTESDFTTIKYSQPIGIEPISTEVPNSFSISQNYPNPFNPSTKISFGIPANFNGEISKVKLSVFDILSREIAVIVNEQLKPGSYEVDWDASAYPSGVYFYMMQTEQFTQTKKMVLIK